MRRQFETLRASELHCPKCGVLRPVRERLLLVVPGGEIHDYRCVVCGASLGSREVKQSGSVPVARP
jgi:DNA-directed RNA polymerase subunit RPC12/RpoP